MYQHSQRGLLRSLLPNQEKACSRGNQGLDGIRVPLRVVELAADCSVYLGAEWLILLLGDIEGMGTSQAAVVS
jgi:hypothetical protein